MSSAPGRIVEILTFDNHGGPSAVLWWAALDDDVAAVKAVSLAARTLADQGVRVVGPLSSADIQARGLKPGQAVPAKA
jgi:hypothetical protein